MKTPKVEYDDSLPPLDKCIVQQQDSPLYNQEKNTMISSLSEDKVQEITSSMFNFSHRWFVCQYGGMSVFNICQIYAAINLFNEIQFLFEGLSIYFLLIF